MKSPDFSFSGVVESCYLETCEGLFFAVKGLEHPPDRWIAVLRYVPDAEKGERLKNGVLYRRMYHFDEQEQWLRTTCPQYLAFDRSFNTMLQSVPRSSVKRIYDPRSRLQELIAMPGVLPLESDARDLLLLLQNEAQVPLSSLGITGSLLIGLHTERSDLDIVAFGTEHCRRVHQALRRLLPSCTELRRLDFEGMKNLFAQRVTDTHMDFDAFVRLEKRKVNQGRFRERDYFIRFIKETNECAEAYGNLRYTPLGRSVISATVADDQESIYTPCRYSICNVRYLEGLQAPDLNEIVSFRGRFCEQALAGETVYAAGTLERLETSQGKISHRLLLGNFPEDVLESSC